MYNSFAPVPSNVRTEGRAEGDATLHDNILFVLNKSGMQVCYLLKRVVTSLQGFGSAFFLRIRIRIRAKIFMRIRIRILGVSGGGGWG